MGKILLIMVILGTFCVSACGNGQSDNNKTVKVEEKKVVVSAGGNETLAKLQDLKKQSEENYLLADNNTRMVELRGREMAMLKKYRQQVEQEAEEQIAANKKQLEDEYQLRMFNLRMQLDSLKMGSKNRELLLNEMDDLRVEREAKLAVLQEQKQNYVSMKMKVYKAEMQKRLDEAEAKLP